MDDVRCVLAAVGSERAAFFGCAVELAAGERRLPPGDQAPPQIPHNQHYVN
jgi:hypothetical protein